jgi:hypothetical protein
VFDIVMTPAAKEQIVWGWLRLVLGFGQIALVGLSIGSLITVGARPLTWAFAIAATTLTVISLLIYKRRPAPHSRERNTQFKRRL